MDAKRFLAETLRRAAEMNADEIWLLSGVGSLAKIENRVQTLLPGTLSAEVVRGMHEECLGLAGRTDLRSLPHACYEVTFLDVGMFRCEYISRRKTDNLRLRREPEALMIEATRNRTLPLLAAEAAPNPSLHRSR
jgi:hypothetical protein